MRQYQPGEGEERDSLSEHRDRSFWEEHAERYDATVKRLFGRPLRRAIALAAEDADGAGRVLEVAAGTGLFTEAVAPRVEHIIATDYAEAMVNVLRARVDRLGLGNVEAAQADLYDLSYPAATFDAVLATNVLHLVPDLPRALGQLCRVLRPGGTIIVPTFCHDQTPLSWLASRAFVAASAQPLSRRFTLTTLREAVEGAGVRVQHSQAIPGVLPIGYVSGVVPGPSLKRL